MLRRVPDVWIFVAVFFALWTAAVALVWKLELLDPALRPWVRAALWLGAAGVWLAWKRPARPLTWLGIAPATLRAVALAAAAFVVMLAIAFVRDRITGTPGLVASDFAASALAVRLSVVLQEELVFRGVIQTRLAEGGVTWIAVLLSSLLFLAIHLPGWSIVGAFTTEPWGQVQARNVGSVLLLGLACGSLRAWSGSLWPGVALHWAYNVGAIPPG
jgi:hypothetical protein